jgi:hypothetical protein
VTAEVLRRFGTCLDHRWDSSLLAAWLHRVFPRPNVAQFARDAFSLFVNLG